MRSPIVDLQRRDGRTFTAGRRHHDGARLGWLRSAASCRLASIARQTEAGAQQAHQIGPLVEVPPGVGAGENLRRVERRPHRHEPVPVGAVLPDVAVQVVEAPRVGRVGAHRQRTADARQCEVHAAYVGVGTPPEERIDAGAVGVLVLVDGGHAIGPAFACREPLAERDDVLVVHAGHRQVVARVLGELPGIPLVHAAVDVHHHAARLPVAGLGDESAVYAVGDRQLGQVVRLGEVGRLRDARPVQRERGVRLPAVRLLLAAAAHAGHPRVERMRLHPQQPQSHRADEARGRPITHAHPPR